MRKPGHCSNHKVQQVCDHSTSKSSSKAEHRRAKHRCEITKKPHQHFCKSLFRSVRGIGCERASTFLMLASSSPIHLHWAKCRDSVFEIVTFLIKKCWLHLIWSLPCCSEGEASLIRKWARNLPRSPQDTDNDCIGIATMIPQPREGFRAVGKVSLWQWLWLIWH